MTDVLTDKDALELARNICIAIDGGLVHDIAIERLARYVLNAKIPPETATPAMIEAAVHACDGHNLSKFTRLERARIKASMRWRAMLNAAPQEPSTAIPVSGSTTPAGAA